MRRRNAILLISPDHMNEQDFRQIAVRARELAPDIKAYVAVRGRRNRTARWVQLLRPTLVVEVEQVPSYRHWRGCFLASREMSKIDSLAILRDAGLPVPRFVEVTPGLVLDPAEWGPYVVVKPARGWRGAYVWVHRTTRVRYKPPESYPEEHPGRRGPMLAQRFIYTGRWPVSYRVLSFLGQPLHAMRYDSEQTQRPLESAEAFREARGVSIVASAKGGRVSNAPEADLLDLAARVHAALPQLPVLGIDLIRDATSGKLFIAEINEHFCWTLSNESGKTMQAEFGVDFYAQYDALELAAQALVRATRRLAR